VRLNCPISLDDHQRREAMEDNSLGEFSPSPPTCHPLNNESFDGGKRDDTDTAEDYYLGFQQQCGSWKT